MRTQPTISQTYRYKLDEFKKILKRDPSESAKSDILEETIREHLRAKSHE